jgi:Cu2+-exporting ATPase
VADAIARQTQQALTPVLIAIDGRVRAVAGLGDRIRRDAVDSLKQLVACGHRIAILSGDHPEVVAAVARRLRMPIQFARGGVTPEQKLAFVEGAISEPRVVMVGDGVNDAAALSAASVGIAVHGGAEASLAAADVFTTREGMAPIVDLFSGARRTMRVIRRGIAFSLLYNLIGVALAMTGVLNPLLAAVLMPLSSLTVVTSAFRSKTF